MTKVVIVEDFPPVGRSLCRMLTELLPEAEVALFETMDRARQHMERAEIHLLFLDLNLNGRDGFSLLRDCVARSFHTIVVSANTDRALEAFEYGVLDFVPKPVTRPRLEKALQRMEDPTGTGRAAQTRLFCVHKGGDLQLIDADRVDYIRGAGKYAELVLCGGGEALHDKSLEKLSVLLAPAYIRIHKSYLVAVCRIKSLRVHGGGKYEALLKSGVRLPVGRSRYAALRDALV